MAEERIAIAVASGAGLDAVADPRFGRAAAFVVTDAAGTESETLANPNVEAAHGAGTGSAAMLARKEVAAVIAGEFGPKAYQALEAAGIAMWVAPAGKTARELLAQFNEGTLCPMQMREFR